MISKLKIGKVTSQTELRNCDSYGCGDFGASRTNSAGTHQGLDIIVYQGESIYAPFESIVTRFGYPYANDTSYRLVEFKGIGSYKGYVCKVMYVNNNSEIVGQTVSKGQFITTAQDISKKYGSGMIPHLHIELRINGQLVDPQKYL